MRRRFIAAVWVFGATVPLLLTTLFVVGCCVLPFHGAMHETVPLCHLAAQQAADDAQPVTPPKPVKRVLVTLSAPMLARIVSTPALDTPPPAAVSHRSFITLGALRCDRDVGLHVSLATFLI